MARMIPQCPPVTNPSKAENRLFYRIRDELTDAWTVLHSLGLGNHRIKPWTETDFVLIGPLGVYCVEVKGGRVSRREGQWVFVDGNDEANSKREGPFEQAGGASAALYKYLKERVPEVRASVVGFGVATPDFTFNIAGPDIIEDVLYDERDVSKKFSAYVNRMSAYWHKRLHGSASAVPLTSSICERIRDQIRPDFDLEPSLRSQMGIVSSELVRLTNEQYRVVDGLVENPRVMIRGGPGTGKSLLAIREARRIAKDGGRVLLCCFNRQLARHLQSILEDCPAITVAHLHGYMAELVKSAGLSHRLPPAEPADLFNVFYPELCSEILLGGGAIEFDALIVDEGQDLFREAYVDVFDGLLKGGIKSGVWRIFYDPNQDIYKGQQNKAIRAFDGTLPAQFKLFTNCRNTQPIAIETSLLAGTTCGETLTVGGPAVKEQWYATPAQQIRQISSHINYLLGNGVRPDEIVILSRRRLKNSSLALGLRSVGFPLTDTTESNWKPADRCLRFSTVAAFKGLEAEAIILADIDDLSSDEARELLYVGTSRARVLLALFFSESVRKEYDLCAFKFGEQLVAGCE